ncbi:hypothetical protein TWF694_003876 [Orbilia ellipsospora]|uniref:Uncharacterized protein n=1 Tax=Orbilia ellipsospora TaxID=2528407 RepID=A0AAV9WZK0_9PEZI
MASEFLFVLIEETRQLYALCFFDTYPLSTLDLLKRGLLDLLDGLRELQSSALVGGIRPCIISKGLSGFLTHLRGVLSPWIEDTKKSILALPSTEQDTLWTSRLPGLQLAEQQLDMLLFLLDSARSTCRESQKNHASNISYRDSTRHSELDDAIAQFFDGYRSYDPTSLQADSSIIFEQQESLPSASSRRKIGQAIQFRLEVQIEDIEQSRKPLERGFVDKTIKETVYWIQQCSKAFDACHKELLASASQVSQALQKQTAEAYLDTIKAAKLLSHSPLKQQQGLSLLALLKLEKAVLRIINRFRQEIFPIPNYKILNDLKVQLSIPTSSAGSQPGSLPARSTSPSVMEWPHSETLLDEYLPELIQPPPPPSSENRSRFRETSSMPSRNVMPVFALVHHAEINPLSNRNETHTADISYLSRAQEHVLPQSPRLSSRKAFQAKIGLGVTRKPLPGRKNTNYESAEDYEGASKQPRVERSGNQPYHANPNNSGAYSGKGTWTHDDDGESQTVASTDFMSRSEQSQYPEPRRDLEGYQLGQRREARHLRQDFPGEDFVGQLSWLQSTEGQGRSRYYRPIEKIERLDFEEELFNFNIPDGDDDSRRGAYFYSGIFCQLWTPDMAFNSYVPCKLRIFRSNLDKGLRICTERDSSEQMTEHKLDKHSELVPEYASRDRDTQWLELYFRNRGNQIGFKYRFQHSSGAPSILHGFQGAILGLLFEEEYPVVSLRINRGSKDDIVLNNPRLQFWSNQEADLIHPEEQHSSSDSNTQPSSSESYTDASSITDPQKIESMGEIYKAEKNVECTRLLVLTKAPNPTIYLFFVDNRVVLAPPSKKSARSLELLPNKTQGIKTLRFCDLGPGIPISSANLEHGNQDESHFGWCGGLQVEFYKPGGEWAHERAPGSYSFKIC